MNQIADIINQYGVPTVVAVGMAYFIYYVWKVVTIDILPSLGKAKKTLIALIDRIRKYCSKKLAKWKIPIKFNIVSKEEQMNIRFKKKRT